MLPTPREKPSPLILPNPATAYLPYVGVITTALCCLSTASVRFLKLNLA